MGGVSRDPGKECRIKIFKPRFISGQGSEGLEKAAPLINIPEQVFDPNARKAGFDGWTEAPDSFRDFQRILPFEMQLSIVKRREGILRQASIQPSCDAIELL